MSTPLSASTALTSSGQNTRCAVRGAASSCCADPSERRRTHRPMRNREVGASQAQEPSPPPVEQREAVWSVVRVSDCALRCDRGAVRQVRTAGGIDCSCLGLVENQREAHADIAQVHASVCEDERAPVVDRDQLSATRIVKLESRVSDPTRCETALAVVSRTARVVKGQPSLAVKLLPYECRHADQAGS